MGAVDGWQLVRSSWCDGLAPDPVTQVSEWADANRMLSRKVAAEPGPWRTSRTPYLREPMDCLSVTSPIQDVVFVAGTQVGKSETGMNWLGCSIDQSPSPFLVVMPTLNLAKRWSRQRFSELVDNTPIIKKKAGEKRSRDSTNTILEKEFEGGSMVVVTGANSAVGLRSMPAKYIHFDEVDGYPHDVDGEGDPTLLAKNRQDSFQSRAKRLYTSTPTEKDASAIEELYEASDRRLYYVACPHCGHEQPLVWTDDDGVKRMYWRDDDPETAGYICAGPECGAIIDERHKREMLESGRWIARSPGPGKAAGFLINSLYSPWVSWASLVKERIEADRAAANGDYSKLKTFTNTREARSWETPGSRVKSNTLRERADSETYRLGTVPVGGLVLTGAVDVQPDRLELLILAWGVGEEVWIVDYRVFYGDTSEDDVWTEMRQVVRTPIRNAWGHDLFVRLCAVDTGYNAQRCYAWLREHEREGFVGVKGFGEEKRPLLGKRSTVDFDWMGAKVPNGAHVYPLGTFVAKEQLMGWLRLTGTGSHRVHYSPDLSDDFFAQLTAEVLVTKWVGSKARKEWWKPKKARNEVLDMFVYNMAVAAMLGLPRWRPIQWEALVKNLQSDDLFGAPAVPSEPEEANEVPQQSDAAPEPDTEPPGAGAPASASPQLPPQPKPVPMTAPRPPARRVGRSSYLKRR